MNTRVQAAEKIEQVAQAPVSRGEIALFQPPRLPWHPAVQERFGIDKGGWKVLAEAIFPNAKTVDSIVMALSYCKARNLDIFKRPVNIVPMWNSSLGREVETVWPGINEIQTSAARTGTWAGMDEPKWGPEKTLTFKGRKKTRDGWEQVEAKVTFPEWCAVTVYRLIDGPRFAFTEPVFWLEAYSRAGGANSELPTAMWIKRPRGQLHKVAKAASLRAAFPEEGEYTAEEMEGKEIEAGGVVIEHGARDAPPPMPPAPPAPATALPPHDSETGEVWSDPPAEPPPVPAQEPDPLEIPPMLRREPENGNGHTNDFTADEQQWLRDLEGAFGGCEAMVELGESKLRLMNPQKGKVSAAAWDRAETLFRARFDELTRAD